ncbi:aggregation-promoting factor C-terminal-like domain-containing protein [Luethyella okanaganae]|uniref:Lytic transglycosylase domain-containing protein n=1 Tax=Luethyella okanaganae TaxID=69372 RepID=A0ABW1VC01_9MICO
MERSVLRSKASLFLFAFTAAVAFVLVNVVDPYSGATASPYFYAAGDRFGGESVQTVDVAGSFEHVVVRDGYTVIEKPKPVAPSVSTAAGSGSLSGWAPPAVAPDPGSAQAYAFGAVVSRGWGTTEFDCLVSLWSKESGWRVNAYNASSGAYGIPQALPGSKMATAGADWETSAATQIEWGLGYVSGRYGTPCGAWAHSQDAGWY